MLHRTIHIRNNAAELERANREIARYLEMRGVARDFIQAISLGLEEAVTNILKYGHDDQQDHQIEITLQLMDSKLRLTIIDDGHEFNPLDQPEPDLTGSLDDREPGGLGIFFLVNLFDQIEYRREKEKNLITLVKFMASPLAGEKTRRDGP